MQVFNMLPVISWTFMLFYLTSNTHFVLSEGVKCGRPGRPTNGTITPQGKTYYPGEKVGYSCLEGFILFGKDERTCLKNGTWTGPVPLCDFNLAKGKKGLQSDTLWSYNPDLAVDGNADTCSFTPRGPEPRWWQVHLGHKFNVVSVGVTISPGSFQEFTIYVIELLADNKALYKPCTTFKGVFQTHKGLFKCNDGLGHPGQFVYIRDDRKEEEYFGLCEVEVFAYRERIPCGDPEVPVDGNVVRSSEDQSQYSCERGFKLEGDAILTCSSKGKWQGHAPRCSEVKCDAPSHTENGYIEIGNPKGEYVYGTEARYGCSPGHKLRGDQVRICEEKGEWSAHAPICTVVSCGDPPRFSNARYTLLNGTSPWTGIAVYTCVEGFKLLYEEEDTVTSCLDSGEWRFLNVSCVPNPVVNAVTRQGHERSLNYEIFTETSHESSVSHVVVILAVIAGILATTIVIGAILLTRRKLLSGIGSLSPLMRPVSKENCYEPAKAKSVLGHTPNTSITSISDNKAEETPSQLHKQIDPAIVENPYISYTNYACNEMSECSLSSEDSCYEKVEPENNYETLRKKNSKEANEDKNIVGYEEIHNGKEPGYEVVQSPVESLEGTYEIVRDKEPGYEIIQAQNDTEPGYEIVSDRPNIHHGYETIKPKLPPPNVTKGVPDILQNLEVLREPCEEVSVNEAKVIPPEVLALYAKVDKTKKNKYKQNRQDIESFSNVNVNTGSDNELNHIPLSSQVSIASESSSTSGTLRPLPPIPKHL